MFAQHLMETATRLAECCNSGREAEALDTLYDEACVSVTSISVGKAFPNLEGF